MESSAAWDSLIDVGHWVIQIKAAWRECGAGCEFTAVIDLSSSSGINPAAEQPGYPAKCRSRATLSCRSGGPGPHVRTSVRSHAARKTRRNIEYYSGREVEVETGRYAGTRCAPCDMQVCLERWRSYIRYWKFVRDILGI